MKSLEWADVVITHAGVGTLIDAMSAGKFPVFMTRRSAFEEHVDDHQVDIGIELSERGLAVELDLTAPSRQVLELAATMKVEGRS